MLHIPTTDHVEGNTEASDQVREVSAQGGGEVEGACNQVQGACNQDQVEGACYQGGGATTSSTTL